MPKEKRSPRMAEVTAVLRTTSNPTLIDSALDDLKDLLEGRVNALRNSYGVTSFTRWGNHVPSYRNNVDALLDNADFQEMALPPIKIALSQRDTSACIGAQDNDLVEVLAWDKRLIFKNPISDKIESWARPFYDRKVGYHSSNVKPSGNKSTFRKGFNDLKHSLDAFDEPIGRLATDDKLYLYRDCDEVVGYLAGSGAETTTLCVQCDRVKRNVGRWYCTRLHAYPYAESEVRRDLNAYRDLITELFE